jgi:hypothetical protein
MIELIIDGKTIQAQPGTVVMDAALQNGIDIPHLCYHPDLSISGGCRLCLVELEGRPNPVPSCGLYCENGMKVHTHTEKLIELRRERSTASPAIRPATACSRNMPMNMAFPKPAWNWMFRAPSTRMTIPSLSAITSTASCAGAVPGYAVRWLGRMPSKLWGAALKATLPLHLMGQ